MLKLKLLNKREITKTNLPGLIFMLFYILVNRFLSVLTTKFFFGKLFIFNFKDTK
jgi:hypothetical protein